MGKRVFFGEGGGEGQGEINHKKIWKCRIIAKTSEKQEFLS